MELFYYCLSAPKEDSLNHTHHYVPPDPIVYDERPEQCDEHLSDDESVVQELREGEEPLNYTDLNDSLHEVEIENEKLRAEAALSPVEEDAVDEPDVIEPELAANLMKRNNSRKFKTPSFKWKKKKKREPATMESPEPYAPAAPVPSAPELTMSEDPIDADSNLDFEDKQIELFDKKISLDSLTDQLQKKESDAAAEAVASDAEVDRLKRDVELFQDRLRESEELLARFRTDNALLQQRVELAERDRGAIQHGNYMELEKVRAEYQSKIDELSTYPERLSSAEARCADAESTADALRSQLADRNTTVADLQSKIDLFQGQIGKLKEKFHSVNEDNIELSNKAQSHERKVLEADLHNKNLMDLVNKKDDSVEQHQLRIEELMRENADLSMQLESTLGDCRRQVESIREKSLLKERSATARIDELEAQLGRVTSTTSQLKRLKDEAEKRSQQRINEMRERLEQANNTTRSMQNYVNFLKQSYSSVFGDTTVAESPYTGRLSPTFKRSPSKSPALNFTDYS